MTNRRRLLLPLLISFSAAACDGDSVPIEDLGTEVVDKVCTYSVRCGTYPDKATCVGSTRSDLGQLTADVNSGKIKYDGNAAADCLNAFAAAGCNLTDQLENPQSCRDTFKGTVADGAACVDGEQCISERCNRSTCDFSVACCAGTCDPKAGAPIAIGGDCSAIDSVCVDGAFCKPDAIGTATCSAKVASGQPCTATFGECVTGTICNLDPTTGTGTCGKAPALGEPCPGGLCNAATDVCDPTADRRCVRRIAVGGACPSGSGCVDYARCDQATMTCIARIAAGGTCAAAADCLGSLLCSTSSTCVLPPPDPVCP